MDMQCFPGNHIVIIQGDLSLFDCHYRDSSGSGTFVVNASLVCSEEVTRPLQHHTDTFVFLILDTDQLVTSGEPFTKIQKRDLTIF